jgi:hypothetical protein
VDWRVKNFETSAKEEFAFLTDSGFSIGTERPEDISRRPITLTVSFVASDARVDASLSLGLGGEDYLLTRVLTSDGPIELQPLVARKGHELRQGLNAHGRRVRAMLGAS